MKRNCVLSSCSCDVIDVVVLCRKGFANKQILTRFQWNAIVLKMLMVFVWAEAFWYNENDAIFAITIYVNVISNSKISTRSTLRNTHTMYSFPVWNGLHSLKLNIRPYIERREWDSFQLNIDKNQKVILKLLEFHTTCYFRSSCRYGCVIEIPTQKCWWQIALYILDSYCSITTKEKSTDTYLKVAQNIFRLLFSLSLSLSSLLSLLAFVVNHDLMVRDLLLILFHTDYVTNKSRIKINICCLMCKADFVVERSFSLSLCSPKSSFLSHAFISDFLLFFIHFLGMWNKAVLVEISTRFEYYIHSVLTHDFNGSTNLIGISSCLRLGPAS